MKALLDFLAVGAGSFLGGGARYLAGRCLPGTSGGGFPWATFAVNIAGCFLLGLVTGLSARAGGLDPRLRLFLAIGFCGGFTTFSTFADENLALLRTGRPAAFALYALASLALGLAAAFLGHRLAE